jgi:hypothetical protein
LEHPPQFRGSVAIATSQPVLAAPSQSAYPLSHEAIVQAPELQASVACARVQAVPHVPQLNTSEVVPISHPSTACPLQSANPGWHPATAHWPATHVVVALGSEHALPHVPQLPRSVARLISHPSRTTLLQSAYPGPHAAIAQVFAAQIAVAFGVRQALPHAPQSLTLDDMFTSHPSAALPLQSA